jgi:hypothetical protein
MSLTSNIKEKEYENNTPRVIEQTSLNGLFSSVVYEFNSIIDEINNKVVILNNLREEVAKAEIKLEASTNLIAKLLREKDNLLNDINSIDANINTFTDKLIEKSNV